MYLIDGDLLLRAIERSDNGLLKDLINDPATEAGVGGWSFPVSDDDQYRWYEAVTNNRSDHQFRYAVTLSEKFVGIVGLHSIDYKNSTACVDIKLSKECRGKGIGTRAMKLVVKYAFDELNMHCLIAEILENNTASRKMHEKAGFQLDGILRRRIYKGGQYHNQCSYSILREEYLEGKEKECKSER